MMERPEHHAHQNQPTGPLTLSTFDGTEAWEQFFRLSRELATKARARRAARQQAQVNTFTQQAVEGPGGQDRG